MIFLKDKNLSQIITRFRNALTVVVIVCLAVSVLIMLVFSPDLSETAVELVSSFTEPNNIRVLRDIGYTTPKDNCRIGDLYMPISGKMIRPVIVVVHGGSWKLGSKSDFEEVNIARYFARHGYAAFNIDYRLLSSGGEFPADIIDIKEALCYLTANAQKLDIDAARMFVLGSSSGGTAAMLSAYTAGVSEFEPSCRKGYKVLGVASISGPTDFAKLSNNPYLQEYLHSRGKVISKISLKTVSPVSYVATAVPTILLHGTEDQNVPIAQAIELAKLLEVHKVPVSLVRIEGQSHFIGASSRREALDMVLHFFSRIP